MGRRIPSTHAILAVLLVVACVAQAQETERRFALVIGNAGYRNLTALKNPANDARDMAKALGRLGFQVKLLIDSGLPKMEEALLDFAHSLSGDPAATGVFYYAGHGVQQGGVNYLIPADADIAGESMIKYKSLSLNMVMDSLAEARNRLNLIILDACRDNPFGSFRTAARGLAIVGQQPIGSVIVYATAAGQTAADGEGRNGVFTGALLKYLGQPLELDELLKLVGKEVQTVTRGSQSPAVYRQFFDNFYLAGGGSARAPATVTAEPQTASAASTPVAESVSTSPFFAVPQSYEAASPSPPQFSIGLWPVVSTPSGLDTNAGLFSVGGGVELSGEYVLPSIPLLFMKAGMEYGFNGLSAGQTLSLLSGLAGLGIRIPITDSLTLRPSAVGGFYYGFVNSAGGSAGAGHAFVSAGIGVSYALGPLLSLGLGASYRFNMDLVQTIDACIGVLYNLSPPAAPTATPPKEKAPEKPQSAKPEQLKLAKPEPAPQPLKAETPKAGEESGKGLVISALSFDSIFPIFHTFYDEHPIGRLTLKNTEGSSVSDVVVSLLIRQYMDAPKECLNVAEMKGGEEKRVDLLALFKNNILDVTQDTKVAAEIAVSYTLGGKATTLSKVETIRVHHRNAMTWDDNRKAAAFVSAMDPAVLMFSNNINAVVKGKLNRAVDKNLQTAMALHEALRLYGISYVSNPLTPYSVTSKDKMVVDTLKFPRETFGYRSGDCSDLSILYCALLESLQIETAFITIPGHIFMAFALKASPEEARANLSHPDELIFRNEKVWVPVEVTEREGNFLVAWQAGAKEWRENLSKEQADFYPVHDAWKIYEPVGMPGAVTLPSLPEGGKVLQALQAVVAKHVEVEIYARVAELQAAITKSKESAKAVNALGVLYARYDLVEKAEGVFQKIVEGGEYVPALVNLGNLYYLKPDMEKALSFYERGYKREPTDAKVLLGIARVNQELENFGVARQIYEELKKVAPSLAQQFAYLELKGEESTRASEISGAKETVIWEEE